MFPNLLGQKALHHLTDADMSKIIGTSRNTYQQKAGGSPRESAKRFACIFKKVSRIFSPKTATRTPVK